MTHQVLHGLGSASSLNPSSTLPRSFRELQSHQTSFFPPKYPDCPTLGSLHQLCSLPGIVFPYKFEWLVPCCHSDFSSNTLPLLILKSHSIKSLGVPCHFLFSSYHNLEFPWFVYWTALHETWNCAFSFVTVCPVSRTVPGTEHYIFVEWSYFILLSLSFSLVT